MTLKVNPPSPREAPLAEALRQVIEEMRAEANSGRIQGDIAHALLVYGDRFEALLRASSSVEASPQDWQSIETAPKDGRWIWVKRVPEGKYSRLSAKESAFKWDADYKGWFAGTGWWPQFPIGWTHWRHMRDQPVEIAAHALRGEASPPRCRPHNKIGCGTCFFDELAARVPVVSEDSK